MLEGTDGPTKVVVTQIGRNRIHVNVTQIDQAIERASVNEMNPHAEMFARTGVDVPV